MTNSETSAARTLKAKYRQEFYADLDKLLDNEVYDVELRDKLKQIKLMVSDLLIKMAKVDVSVLKLEILDSNERINSIEPSKKNRRK